MYVCENRGWVVMHLCEKGGWMVMHVCEKGGWVVMYVCDKGGWSPVSALSSDLPQKRLASAREIVHR